MSQPPWFKRFVEKHFFDYTRRSALMWVTLTLFGCGLFGWAVWACFETPNDKQFALVAGVLALLVVSLFPARIKRSKFVVVGADVFMYLLLGAVGMHAAILAAGLEALVGTARSSKRLSSLFVSPAAAACSMAIAGLVYQGLRLPASSVFGEGALLVDIVALCIAALIHVSINMYLALSLFAAKRGQWVRFREWASATSWVAVLSLAWAFVAGLLLASGSRLGYAMMGLAACVAVGLSLLLQHALDVREQEREAQESKVEEAQRQAQISQRQFASAFAHAAIGMAIVNARDEVVRSNRALQILLNRSEAELAGRSFLELLQSPQAELLRKRTQALAVGDDRDAAFSMEIASRHQDAELDHWLSVHCSPYPEAGEAAPSFIYQVHDITLRHEAERRLQHVAYHDGLTHLANRSCFHERLRDAIERTQSAERLRFAVMFLDLDRFKLVNDSLGHEAGNCLLREVAMRLRRGVPKSALVARIGGDEFAVLLEIADLQQAYELAPELLALLSEPLVINGTEVMPSASLGLTFSDMGYRESDEILRDADLAMYQAKAKGRGCWAEFSSEMHAEVADRLSLETDLRRAIGEGKLSLQYQPIFDLHSHRPVALEALARWHHAQRGEISPSVFITLAEDTGHIGGLTRWVLEHALIQLRQWDEALGPNGVPGLHVNVSGKDLISPMLVDHVAKVLQREGLRAERLTLEITETRLMENFDLALVTMNRLRDLGVRFSIDDFGTGYSSLAYLSRLPISSLKIDRSFVIGPKEPLNSPEIIQAVVQLGRTLGRVVIAEGVQTSAQVASLREAGVQFGQGYLLSRPMEPHRVPALLHLKNDHSATEPHPISAKDLHGAGAGGVA